MNTIEAFVGVGANLGDAQAAVRDALKRLGQLPHSKLLAASHLYRSAPVDSSGPDYMNAVARLETTLPAQALLLALQAIEQLHGRERPYRNAPRTLDLDLLLYGAEQIDTALLQVPHPRLCQRAFVLLPLLELAPDIVIPGVLTGGGRARQFVASVAGQSISKIEHI